MIDEPWHRTPAVILITEDDQILFVRAGAPLTGLRAKEIVVIANHPALAEDRHASEWLEYFVKTRLGQDGVYREVWKQ